jgi:hypothetical protein
MVIRITMDNNEVDNSLFWRKGNKHEMLIEARWAVQTVWGAAKWTHNTCIHSLPDPSTDLNTNMQLR